MRLRYLRSGLVAAALVAAAALAWFIWEARVEGFDSRAFWRSMRQADWRWLLATAAMMQLSFVGRAMRWRVMIEPIRPHARVWNLLRATLVGFAAVVLLGRPGELVRPYIISVSEEVSFPSQLACWLLERIYDILLVVALFGLALGQLNAWGGNAPAAAHWAMKIGGWVAGICAVVCGLLLFGLHRWSGELRVRLGSGLGFLSAHHQEKLARRLETLVEGLYAMRQMRSIVRVFLWSVAQWAVIVGGYAAYFRAFPETVGLGLTAVLVYVGFVAFGSLVQIPGIGGGIQIVSTVVLVEFFKVDLEAAVGISILVWLVAMGTVVPVGLVVAAASGLQMRKLRKATEEVEP